MLLMPIPAVVVFFSANKLNAPFSNLCTRSGAGRYPFKAYGVCSSKHGPNEYAFV